MFMLIHMHTYRRIFTSISTYDYMFNISVNTKSHNIHCIAYDVVIERCRMNYRNLDKLLVVFLLL